MWFFLPSLWGLPYLPITTINNPLLGLGVFQQTPWYYNPIPNFFEAGSWVLLSALMGVSIWQWKKKSLA